MSKKLAWSGVAGIAIVLLSAAEMTQPVLAKSNKTQPVPEHHVRVGVIAPRTAKARAATQRVREIEMQHLAVIGVEPVLLNAATENDALAKAKALDCEYVLESALDRKLATLHYRLIETHSGLRVLEADERLHDNGVKQPEPAETLVTQAMQAIRYAVQ